MLRDGVRLLSRGTCGRPPRAPATRSRATSTTAGHFTASCAFLLPFDAVPLVTCSRGYYRMFDMLPPGLIISAVRVVLMTALLIGIGPLAELL